MTKQTRTTIRELAARYRTVLRRAFMAGLIGVPVIIATGSDAYSDDYYSTHEVDDMIGILDDKIRLEVFRAEAAEEELRNKVDDTYSYVSSSYNGLNESIGIVEEKLYYEIERATVNDKKLGDSITTETTRAKGAEEELAAKIADEAARAQRMENGLAFETYILNGRLTEFSKQVQEDFLEINDYVNFLQSGLIKDASAIAVLNGDDATDGSVAYYIKQYADENIGTIHGLIADPDATETTTGKPYAGNLAVGTTVEDHLAALDAAIGDRRTLDGEHLIANDSIVANLQSLNDGIVSEAAARAQGDIDTLNAANAYTDAAFASGGALTLKSAAAYTDSRVDNLEKEMSAGIANTAALSSVAVSNVKRGEVSVGGGYGYHNSQSAAAFGAAMGLSDNWSVNAGVGISREAATFRAGTNYKFKLF